MTAPKLNSNLIAVIFGCVVCFFLLGLVEGTLRIMEKLRPSSGGAPTYPKDFFKQDEFGVFEAAPGSHQAFHKGPDGKLIYDRHYVVDEYGRRSTPVDTAGRDRFIAFLGCSFTFGEGIGDEETLPYFVGQLAPGYVPYNYGLMGLAPYDVLAKIENIDFKNEIKETPGIFIYVFMADHLSRIMGSTDAMRWNFNGAYYQASPEGNLVRKGDYRNGRPFLTRFYTLLNKSRIFRALKIHLPMKMGDADLKRVAQAAQSMDDAIKAKYPESSFYVVIYPGPHPPRLAQYLDEKGVKYLDYTDLFSNVDPNYYISKDDQHPSALAYRTIAEHIVKDLRLGNAPDTAAR